MIPIVRTTRSALAALALLALAAACSSDSGTDAPNSPLDGLVQAAGTDSAGNAQPPAPPGTKTPGSFHGTVLGPSVPGSGNDSLQTAPRVAGARVTAYPVLGGVGANAQLGPEEASVVTGADGKFALPMLAGGEYRVTITPPSGSPYAGVWVTAVAHAGSNEHPWWVVLPKR